MGNRHSAAVERMTSLTFALLGAAQTQGQPARSSEWIQRHVPGYPQDSDGADGAGAFRKALKRDIADLRKAGVPISLRSGNGRTHTMVRIDEDSYRLPPVSFTPEEAVVLGLAGGVGQEGGLSQYSQTGWTKITAAGATRGVVAPTLTATNDLSRLEAEDFRHLSEALARNLRITFQYRASPVAELEKRVMDPWGFVTREGRVYLVGWDVRRQAERAFRITRIQQVKISRTPKQALEPTRDLEEIVEEIVGPRDLVDALVSIPEGQAVELAARGTRRADGLVEMHGVSAQWLARTAIGFAPEVEVLEPQEVRQAIAGLAAAALGGAASDEQGED